MVHHNSCHKVCKIFHLWWSLKYNLTFLSYSMFTVLRWTNPCQVPPDKWDANSLYQISTLYQHTLNTVRAIHITNKKEQLVHSQAVVVAFIFDSRECTKHWGSPNYWLLETGCLKYHWLLWNVRSTQRGQESKNNELLGKAQITLVWRKTSACELCKLNFNKICAMICLILIRGKKTTQ